MQLKEIITYLEQIAPAAYQESYDNSGLIVGDAEKEVTGVLVTLDCLEATIEEAFQNGCNVVVAHHPIVFKGLKRLNGKNYVERVVMAAIRKGIAVYAIHTNLDSMLHKGVNTQIAERLGLQNCRILAPQGETLAKLEFSVPIPDTEKVIAALHIAGAGEIGNYKNCSFRVIGVGAFLPSEGANPTIGNVNVSEKVAETKVEMIFPRYLQSQVLKALKNSHPYEEIAYFITNIQNEHQEVGSGMVGELSEAMTEEEFLHFLKQTMQVSCIKYTALCKKEGEKIRKIAICGGSGSFLLPKAIGAAADFFVTSDFKYHEFFDAEGRIVIADIGHFESEQYTIDLLQDLLEKKYSDLLVFSTKICTNPVNYL